MNGAVKKEIYELVYTKLSAKIEGYNPESEHKPFFTRIFSNEMVLTHSIVQSFYTSFGMSIYEQIAELLAAAAGFEAIRQYRLEGDIDLRTSQMIEQMWEHDKVNGSSNKLDEIEKIRNSIYPARNAEVQHHSVVDLFIKRPDGHEFYIDIKTVKPNLGELESFKRKLLLWVGYRLSVDRDTQLTTCIAVPYNPFHPRPYLENLRGGMGRVLDSEHDVLVQENFWNLVGGSNSTYDELLGVFEQVGRDIKSQLDSMF
ncbi:MAG TPA: TdeIII family type II restriction endonuclease [Bacilli bacterium]|nr:TdeIII family type II restriction endonuclease [Bacilli bacterium]